MQIINTNAGSVLIGGDIFATGFSSADRLLEIHSGSSSSSMLALHAGEGKNTSAIFLMVSQLYGASLYSGKSGTGTYQPFLINVGGGDRMKFLTNGQIVIGNGLCATPMPADGLLGVNGSIYAKAVKVKMPNASNCFPDFVFNSNYKLASLEDVEKFVKENKHLPEVPSAADVERDGINVAEMDATLLKKIEELTLYMIKLKKENMVLRKEMEALKKEVSIGKK